MGCIYLGVACLQLTHPSLTFSLSLSLSTDRPTSRPLDLCSPLLGDDRSRHTHGEIHISFLSLLHVGRPASLVGKALLWNHVRFYTRTNQYARSAAPTGLLCCTTKPPIALTRRQGVCCRFLAESEKPTTRVSRFRLFFIYFFQK